VEAILARRFREKRLHIRAQEDLEQVAQLILDKDLDDFCWSLDFDAEFLERLFSNGFLPICSRLAGSGSSGSSAEPLYVLLPKLHRQRCLLWPWHTLRVDRGAKKRSKQFRISADAAFQQVVDGCIEQHGESWLWPPMRELISTIFSRQQAEREQRRRERGEEEASAEAAQVQAQAEVHSIELWTESNELVAGELGIMCGAMFTSLTGFYRQAGTGTVQMLALAGLLISSGCECWDLGMSMDYKVAMGAANVPRRTFMTLQRQLRRSRTVQLPRGSGMEGGAAAGTSAHDAIAHVVSAKSKAAEAPGSAAASSAGGAPGVAQKVVDDCCSDAASSSIGLNVQSKIAGEVAEAPAAPADGRQRE